MATLSFVKQRLTSDAAGDIDLDLTPMMSMFLILLPFLVSMAVLTHLTVLEFSLPPNVGAGTSDGRTPKKPQLKLTVVITPAFLLTTHGEQMLDSIPVIDRGYDFERLRNLLGSYTTRFETNGECIVASNDHVALSSVVTLMDNCKAAGYAKIGLSSATGDPREGK